MDELRAQALAARVVAWHNRHPLARRIDASQVRSIGYLAMRFGAAPVVAAEPVGPEIAAPAAIARPGVAPVEEEDYTQAFESLADGHPSQAAQAPPAIPDPGVEVVLPDPDQPDALAQDPAAEPVAAAEAAPEPPAEAGAPVPPKTLRERVLSSPAAAPELASPTRDAVPLPFTAPPAPQAMLRWMLRHGTPTQAVPADGPLRWLSGGAQPPEVLADTFIVCTAAIDSGALRSRVLIAGDPDGPIFGPRLWSLPRWAALAVASIVMSAGGTLVAVQAWTSHQPVELAHRVAAPRAADPAPDQAADRAASAATPASAQPMLLAAAPPEALPQAGEVAKPLLGLHLSDEEKAAAREARAQAQRQSRGAPAAAALAPPPGARADPPAAALAPAAFAISTRPLRTRAEAEQLQTAMRGLLQAQGGAALSLELLPQNDDWRVVAWPFAAQADADAARSLLASRGMRVEVVHF